MAPKEAWYQNLHVWAVILADSMAIVGIISKSVPSQYSAILATVAHGLFAIDQIVDGINNPNPVCPAPTK